MAEIKSEGDLSGQTPEYRDGYADGVRASMRILQNEIDSVKHASDKNLTRLVLASLEKLIFRPGPEDTNPKDPLLALAVARIERQAYKAEWHIALVMCSQLEIVREAAVRVATYEWDKGIPQGARNSVNNLRAALELPPL
jgi:hypothetical protein